MRHKRTGHSFKRKTTNVKTGRSLTEGYLTEGNPKSDHLLGRKASQLALCKVTGMSELGGYFIAQDFLSHLFNSLAREQGERFRNTDRGDAAAVRITKFVHRVHLGRGGIVQVSGRLEGNTSVGLCLEGLVVGSLSAIKLEVSNGRRSGDGL